MNDNRALVYILCILVIAMVFADRQAKAETWMDFNLGSWHSEDNDYNESNFGLGITTSMNENVDLIGGFFENSYYKETIYAGVSLHTDLIKHRDSTLQLGIVGAGATGYSEQTGQEITIYPMPQLTYKYKRVKAAVGVIPGEVQVATLQVGVMF